MHVLNKNAQLVLNNFVKTRNVVLTSLFSNIRKIPSGTEKVIKNSKITLGSIIRFHFIGIPYITELN